MTTQVGILKSPSVLMPTFEFVYATNRNAEPGFDLLFSKWKKNNLKIQLEDDTSILNISYRDTNKNLVVPVLQKISSTYQEYSGIRKKNTQELS